MSEMSQRKNPGSKNPEIRIQDQRHLLVWYFLSLHNRKNDPFIPRNSSPPNHFHDEVLFFAKAAVFDERTQIAKSTLIWAHRGVRKVICLLRWQQRGLLVQNKAACRGYLQ